jgi:DNA-binding response OmpR family regulator
MPDTRPFIFMVDDDEDDLAMLSFSLEEQGVKTRSFTSGAMVMAYFDGLSVYHELPSLVILDFNMPMMNGLETLTMIKKCKKVQHIPVILYSTVISPLFEMNARNLGAFACMSKAMNMSDFGENVACFSDLAHSLMANSDSVCTQC